tara:strand:+ start:139 stop:555 length:417 start_codon:yes stop_codon:yes gene_type:complete
LSKKISDKDKKVWQDFINNSQKLENKDLIKQNNLNIVSEKNIDLHGFSLDEANKKIFEFIENCFSSGVNKINIITGKGLRSNNLNDPYKSNDLSILKHSVPNFIKNNPDLMDKIIRIDEDAVNSPSKGSFDIFLKKKL